MKFELSQDEMNKINNWVKEIHQDIIKTSDKDSLKIFTSAIGGYITYSFTPTNIGLVTKIKEELSGKELDLTDYESW